MKKEKQQTQETQEVLDTAVAIEVVRPSLAPESGGRVVGCVGAGAVG